MHLPPLTTLWIRGRLPRLHRVCLASWVRHGHPVRLYCYDPPPEVPRGVELRDARDVLPARAIFRYGPEAHSAYENPELPGGYGGFSNWWRYAYLWRWGGWWLDADVALLRPLDFDEPYVWAAESKDLLNNAVLRLRAGSPLAAGLLMAAERIGGACRFAETGPTLLTAQVVEHGLRWYTQATSTFYPHHWRDWHLPFVAERPLPERSHAIHFWHEILRRETFDCDAIHPPTSQFEQIASQN